MKQSRSTSFIKSLVSTAVGFLVAMAANAAVLPFFGWSPTLSENLVLTTIYTAISIARGYALERIFETLGWRTRMSAFALAVLAERQRQIIMEGYDAHHDAEHSPRLLARAGACYFLGGEPGRALWPFLDGYKPDNDDMRRDLVRGCALGLAAGELAAAQRLRTEAA